jgi:hypothetical protein
MRTGNFGAAGAPSRLLAVALAFFFPWAAAAQTSPYCRKVRARAAGDAALLMSPRIVVQGIRFPSNGQVEGSAGVVIGAWHGTTRSSRCVSSTRHRACDPSTRGISS